MEMHLTGELVLFAGRAGLSYLWALLHSGRFGNKKHFTGFHVGKRVMVANS